MGTLGDIIYRASSVWATLAANSTGTKKYLQSLSSAAPSWQQIAMADISDYTVTTFTPVLEFSGATSGITYTTQTGSYVKIGNLLCYWGRITLSSKGISAGNADIAAIPVAASGQYGWIGSGYFNNFNTITNITGFHTPGTTTVQLQTAVATGVTPITNVHFNNTSDFLFAGFSPV